MAIAEMTKVIIAAHQSQAAQLLEALQEKGILEVLNAERAMVTKEWPELQVETKRPKNMEDMVVRLEKAVAFLSEYTEDKPSFFSPLVEIDSNSYSQVVSGSKAIEYLEQAEKYQRDMEKLGNSKENLQGLLICLEPWKSLETPVEQIREVDTVTCLLGLIPHQYYDEVCRNLSEKTASIEQVGGTGNTHACVVACMNECAGDVQKILRSGDFEPVNFEGMTGTVKELIEQNRTLLEKVDKALEDTHKQAERVAEELLSLKILHDHYCNLLNREQTHSNIPATETTVLLEGWVKTADYDKLQKIIADFDACSVDKIEPAEGEEIPVEIENNTAVRPFEVVTRLYGMPQPTDVDPTAFLAPFFALFFGLCLTDAGYGLVMMAALWYFIKKMQGDKKLMWMLMVSAALTVLAGALTGSWFGNAVQVFIPALEPVRVWILNFGFDPLEDPMKFFGLSLGLGYIQIIVGIVIAFVHNLRRKKYVAAVCDQLTWLVMLNSIVIYGCSAAGVVSPAVGGLFGKIALVPAVMIVLFSQREGGIGGRLGMGAYQLFSTIFFMGDVLSYLRLMALGMVTAGLGMAINVITGIVGDIPYIGWIIGLVVFVGGHLFNLVLSGLSAFVHTLRLQYVEFFPKFLEGGGRDFQPLAKTFKHVYVKKQET